MNIKIKKLIIYTISLIPIQKFKIFLYRNILGYEIDYSCKLGFFNLIYCKEFKLSENVKFGNFNKVTCLNGKVLISSNGIIKNNIIINGNGILSIDNDCVVNNNTYFDLAKNKYPDFVLRLMNSSHKKNIIKILREYAPEL